MCTGNICRSPAAERLLGRTFGPTLVTSSAGTRAQQGAPIHPPIAACLTAVGADAGGFRARQLTPQLLSQADLILTMTRAHRSETVSMSPGTVRRSFTLLELARLAALVPAEQLTQPLLADRWSALVPLAAAQRHHTASSATHDDVPDPYGQGEAASASAFAQVEQAVAVIAGTLLAGTSAVRG